MRVLANNQMVVIDSFDLLSDHAMLLLQGSWARAATECGILDWVKTSLRKRDRVVVLCSYGVGVSGVGDGSVGEDVRELEKGYERVREGFARERERE